LLAPAHDQQQQRQQQQPTMASALQHDDNLASMTFAACPHIHI
jgi:hypothetical protein